MLATGVVGWSGLVAPRLAPRLLVPLHAVLGTVLVMLATSADAPLGLRPPALRRGLRSGLAAAAAAATLIGVSTTVPAVRTSMLQRELPPSIAEWLLVRIPIGTVWSEEAAYRGAVDTVATRAFGPRRGRILQAVAFGLSHVADARGAGEPMARTVLITGVAGWLFSWLRATSGSLVAPILAHLAINEAGAIAAVAVQRRDSGAA